MKQISELVEAGIIEVIGIGCGRVEVFFKAGKEQSFLFCYESVEVFEEADGVYCGIVRHSSEQMEHGITESCFYPADSMDTNPVLRILARTEKLFELENEEEMSQVLLQR